MVLWSKLRFYSSTALSNRDLLERNSLCFGESVEFEGHHHLFFFPEVCHQLFVKVQNSFQGPEDELSFDHSSLCLFACLDEVLQLGVCFSLGSVQAFVVAVEER